MSFVEMAFVSLSAVPGKHEDSVDYQYTGGLQSGIRRHQTLYPRKRDSPLMLITHPHKE